MKNFVVALVLAVGLAFPQTAGAIIGIPGYYNPTTSTFVPLVTPKAVPNAPAVTRTGTVKVTITLSIESAIGADASITCSANISTSDASFDNFASASGVVARSGSTGTLTMPIPYDWTMAASGEQVTISVSCSEGFASTGGVEHSITFVAPLFVVPSKPGTVTTKSYSGSL